MLIRLFIIQARYSGGLWSRCHSYWEQLSSLPHRPQDKALYDPALVGTTTVPESPAWGALGMVAVALVGILSRRKTKLLSKA
jgi:hypothetical protein